MSALNLMAGVATLGAMEGNPIAGISFGARMGMLSAGASAAGAVTGAVSNFFSGSKSRKRIGSNLHNAVTKKVKGKPEPSENYQNESMGKRVVVRGKRRRRVGKTNRKIVKKFAKTKKTYRKKRRATRKPRVALCDLTGIPTESQCRKVVLSMGGSFPKRFKVDAGIWRYQQSHQGFADSKGGTQGVNSLFLLAAAKQVLTSTGVAYGTYENNTALQALNPYDKITGSSLHTTGFVPLNDKFFLRSIQLEIEFVNMTSINTEVELIAVKCISNPYGSDAITKWGMGLQNDGLGQAVISPSTSPAAGTPRVTEPGIHYPGTLAPKFFKTLFRQKVFISGGGNSRYEMSISANKLVDIAVNKELLTGLFVPNQTIQFFIVQRGALGYDSVGDVISYLPTRLGWNATVKYAMSSVSGNAGRLNCNYMADQMKENAVMSSFRVANTFNATGATPVQLGL